MLLHDNDKIPFKLNRITG